MKILIVQNPDKTMQPMMHVSKDHVRKIKQIIPKAQIVTIQPDKQTLSKHLKDTTILFSYDVQFDLKKAPAMQWIHVPYAGVNAIPQDLLKSHIVITNSSGVHPTPIAEHVLCFMLMFARQTHKSYRTQIQEKTWKREYSSLDIFELQGKTVSIVGFGRIGKKIAQLSHALGMHVIAVVKTPKKKLRDVDKMYPIQKLSQVLAESDFVVNALPLTSETKYLFTMQLFKKMKKTAYFINIGRGQTVKEKDLIKVLKEERIRGAALDVFEEEPLPNSSELWNLKNTIITPHYSGWTPHYMDRVVDIFCVNLQAFLANKPMPNKIDKKKGY